VLVEIEGDGIMLRHIAIGLAVAVITCASASNVAAHGGGHGGHGGGGSFAAAHAGSAGSFSGGHSVAFSGSHAAFANHAAFGNHFVDRGFGFHHRFHRRFFFVGGPGVYGYDDGCYGRIWTRWGWRWTNVCY
jgi:hypothetical protein